MSPQPPITLKTVLTDPAVGLLSCALISAAFGFLCVLLSTHVFHIYGTALFCGMPLALGFLAPYLYGIPARRSFSQLLVAGIVAQAALFAGMVLFAIEGLGCIIMASPLWITLAVVGALVAYPVHRATWGTATDKRGFPVIGLLIVAAMPLWMGAESAVRPEAPLWSVSTSVDIDAPPEEVWPHVIAFPALPAPTETFFKIGVAYPLHATIDGHGPGAMRRCVFTTGAFVEPITVWDEARLLAFDVIESPPSMQELSPYNIHPPHLEGFLISKRGQFELIDLGNGRTRLIGTTWYQNRMSPTAYWRLWSDPILHTIHHRVLGHVKQVSEESFHAAANARASNDFKRTISANAATKNAPLPN